MSADDMPAARVALAGSILTVLLQKAIGGNGELAEEITAAIDELIEAKLQMAVGQAGNNDDG